MEKITRTFLIIGFISIALLIINNHCNCKKPISPIDPETVYIYETDSIYKDKYFELKKELDKKTQPKTVIIYKEAEPRIDSVKFIPGELVLYIKGLEEEIIIKDGFLSQYPHNDKLITFDLDLDNLSITTLNKDAKTITKEYPLYLYNFKYQWRDNELFGEIIKDRTPFNKEKTQWNNLFLNTGYDFMIYEKPNLGLEYNLDLGRFKFDTEINTTISDKPQLYFNSKIGYRLLR